MKKSKTAIVVFVKTPFYSQIKTRLAAQISSETALEFYFKSVDALQKKLSQLKQHLPIQPYWAVAEVEAVHDPLWKSFDRVAQKKGSLGERLSSVEEMILDHHESYIFIGADCPHIKTHALEQAVKRLQSNQNFVLAPAEDGGYVLFGSQKKLGLDLWTSVPYSCEQTTDVFIKQLSKMSDVELLESHYDIDRLEDLQRLSNEVKGSPDQFENLTEDLKEFLVNFSKFPLSSTQPLELNP